MATIYVGGTSPDTTTRRFIIHEKRKEIRRRCKVYLTSANQYDAAEAISISKKERCMLKFDETIELHIKNRL